MLFQSAYFKSIYLSIYLQISLMGVLKFIQKRRNETSPLSPPPTLKNKNKNRNLAFFGHSFAP